MLLAMDSTIVYSIEYYTNIPKKMNVLYFTNYKLAYFTKWSDSFYSRYAKRVT